MNWIAPVHIWRTKTKRRKKRNGGRDRIDRTEGNILISNWIISQRFHGGFINLIFLATLSINIIQGLEWTTNKWNPQTIYRSSVASNYRMELRKMLRIYNGTERMNNSWPTDKLHIFVHISTCYVLVVSSLKMMEEINSMDHIR